MSVTAATGFVANGVACGIKRDGALDLALVATADGRAVPAAAVFTSNKAAAAPVEVSRRHLAATGGRAAAVVVNSGNANAATGEPGRAVAGRSAALVASALGCRAEEVLVCSTGLIGIPLPVDPFERGIGPLVAGSSPRGARRAGEAILTTDRRPKDVVVVEHGFVVGGMAKGSGMLAPDMATMLAVLTTDAAVDPPVLAETLRAAVSGSFNALSVDGCTSTNDTVVLLAGGQAGEVDQDGFADAVGRACGQLASEMADDAEGATKVVTVEVRGARSPEEARAAARKVAESQLVKCSLYGEDPYWGRVVSELGSAGVAFDLDRVSVAYGDVVVCRRGVAAGHDRAAVRAHLRRRHVALRADLGLGDGAASVLTSDLGPGYIEENRGTS